MGQGWSLAGRCAAVLLGEGCPVGVYADEVGEASGLLVEGIIHMKAHVQERVRSSSGLQRDSAWCVLACVQSGYMPGCIYPCVCTWEVCESLCVYVRM